MADTRFRWPTLLQENLRPLFVLNHGRRLRFVNDAWLKLTGEADVLGKACMNKGPTESLYRTLAPPKELATRSVAVVRRPAPPLRSGPPWWDITFFKLETAEGSGYLGIIDVVPATPSMPAKSSSPFIGSLRKKHAEAYTFDLFAGASPAAERFRAKLRHAAECRAPVWIHGEPGSGKQTAARVIHHHSPERERPFIRLDCAALQPYLLQGLLFGTGGVAAQAGTLHLRNPAALPRDLQKTLSDWLLTDAKAPRMICTSTQSANDNVASSALRPEYATHLAVLELATLPLRERLDELPRIATTIAGTPPPEETLAVLRAHRWPRNLHELREALASPTLPRYLHEKSLGGPELVQVPRPSLDSLLETVERKLLLHALAESHGNLAAAATRLGIARTRLSRRLEALGIKEA